MNDREMLEYAAKAAGAVYVGWHQDGILVSWPGMTADSAVLWNPLEHDGDEARLEAVLRLCIWWYPTYMAVGGVLEAYADHAGDHQAARRRAGVRAAAEIGRAMP